MKNDMIELILFGLILLAILFLVYFKLTKSRPIVVSICKLLLLFLCNLLLLELIQMFTIKPEARDGNGNPAIILWLPSLVLALALCVNLFKTFTLWNKPTRKVSAIIALVGCIFSIISVWCQVVFARSLLSKLSEIEHVTSQHLNTLYFNYWTFIFFLGLTLMVTGVWLWKKIK
jgi:hypothetical protein